VADLTDTVSAYLEARKALEEVKDRHKTEIEAAEAELNKYAEPLLDFCNTHNTDSVKTDAGTIMRTVRSRYWTSDWASFYEVVRQYDAPFLLEQRIHNGNMKQFLDENPEAVPPGLQADRKYAVQVRKPNSK